MMSRYQVIEGDSLLELSRLEAGRFAAVITDPPYSSGALYRGDRVRSNTGDKYLRNGDRDFPDFVGDTRDQRSFGYWVSIWSADCLRVVEDGGLICVFCDWRQLPTVSDAIQAGGWVWRGVVVWDKLNARPQRGRFSAQCEFIVWGSRGALSSADGDPCPRGVVACRNEVTKDRHHQTAKPIEVMSHLMAIVRPGGEILDPFAGSGSTGVAAMRAGFRFCGIELSSAYAEVCRDRLEAEASGMSLSDVAAGQVPMFQGVNGD